MIIADLKLDDTDQMGEVIARFYGFKPPEYAVYATKKRLMVWYADDPVVASEQRKGLAQLSPVRGEINGLIDGWRESRWHSVESKATRYDRRVADAIIVALERDIGSAEVILRQVEHDLIDERTSWARLEYLLSSLLLSVIFAIFVWFLPPGIASRIWRAAAAGALGAFFSISLGIQTRTVLPDLRKLSNLTDAALRVLIGFIGAGVLISLVNVGVVTVSFGNVTTSSNDPNTAWLMVLIIGFLAGFSERLVPDLLTKAGVTATHPSIPPAPSQTAAQEGKATSIASAETTTTPKPAATPEQGTAGSEDVSLQEAADDHCICTVEVDTAEATQDSELPAASGGVASGAVERST